MKSRIIQMGNSKGVRIPKRLMDEAGLGEVVEIRVEDNSLVITPVAKPREGWAVAFAEMARRGEDVPVVERATNAWDQAEWEW